MRGITPPVLFELRAHEWRNAVDLHHLPGGTHSLAPRPGSLVRLTFQIGPRGRTCTCNLSVLSGTPLRWARSEEHTSELQSRLHLVCRLLLEKKKISTGSCADGPRI